MNWYSEWTLQLIYFIGLIPRVRLGPAGGRQICLPCFWVGPPSLFLKALEMTSLTTGAMSPLRQSFHANFSSQIRNFYWTRYSRRSWYFQAKLFNHDPISKHSVASLHATWFQPLCKYTTRMGLDTQSSSSTHGSRQTQWASRLDTMQPRFIRCGGNVWSSIKALVPRTVSPTSPDRSIL